MSRQNQRPREIGSGSAYALRLTEIGITFPAATFRFHLRKASSAGGFRTQMSIS
ncbi:hypothetical protein HYR99_10240 [Candidatus Poribacteria bacterium]|nr:hypothetical protein [Candidatus Poribacteria bacterium]